MLIIYPVTKILWVVWVVVLFGSDPECSATSTWRSVLWFVVCFLFIFFFGRLVDGHKNLIIGFVLQIFRVRMLNPSLIQFFCMVLLFCVEFQTSLKCVRTFLPTIRFRLLFLSWSSCKATTTFYDFLCQCRHRYVKNSEKKQILYLSNA